MLHQVRQPGSDHAIADLGAGARAAAPDCRGEYRGVHSRACRRRQGADGLGEVGGPVAQIARQQRLELGDQLIAGAAAPVAGGSRRGSRGLLRLPTPIGFDTLDYLPDRGEARCAPGGDDLRPVRMGAVGRDLLRIAQLPAREGAAGHQFDDEGLIRIFRQQFNRAHDLPDIVDQQVLIRHPVDEGDGELDAVALAGHPYDERALEVSLVGVGNGREEDEAHVDVRRGVIDGIRGGLGVEAGCAIGGSVGGVLSTGALARGDGWGRGGGVSVSHGGSSPGLWKEAARDFIIVLWFSQNKNRQDWRFL